ncbi:MAG: hypothetical protein QXY62_06155 [Candidatus Altiarchaeota archaeon]
MGFFDWIRNKITLRKIFPVINSITDDYNEFLKEHPDSSHEEALLYSIRWRFNRAFFGSESPTPGSRLYGEFPDAGIIKILKELNCYDTINKAAAFTAGLELQNIENKKKGFEPYTETIAKVCYTLSGIPWKPKNMEEAEKIFWSEMELRGFILKGAKEEKC